MKTFLTLFFICQQLNPTPWLTTNVQNRFETNEEVVKDEAESLTFDLNEQLYQDRTFLSRTQVRNVGYDRLKQKAFSESLIKTHPGLRIELEEKTFDKLVNYAPNATIKYIFNYEQSLKITTSIKQNYSLEAAFDLIFDENLVEKDQDINKSDRLIKAKIISWPKYNRLADFLLKTYEINFVMVQEKHYLEVNTALGLDTFSVYYSLTTWGDENFNWFSTLILRTLKIEIHYETYDFKKLKVLTKTYFYHDQSEKTLEELRTTYLTFLKEEYFRWLQDTYPKLTFNFDKFDQDLNFKNFNKNLFLNKLTFKLEAKDSLQQFHQISVILVLVYQENFVWKQPLSYETSSVEQLIDELKKELESQGYQSSWFNFELKESKIFVSSNNPDFLNFEPIMLTYKLISTPPLEDEPEPKLIDSDNVQEIEKNDGLSSNRFSKNYFFFLFLPFSFLIAYLSILFFWKRRK